MTLGVRYRRASILKKRMVMKYQFRPVARHVPRGDMLTFRYA